MAESIVKASILYDTSQMQSGTVATIDGLKGMAAQANLTMETMKTKSQAMAQAAEQAASRVTAAQRAIAMASIENRNAMAAERLAIRDAVKGYGDAGDAVTLLAEKQAVARASALQLAAAQEAVAVASHKTVTDVQATSAAIRSMEGNPGIRALENFLAKTLNLGPAMSSLFPIIGAGAFLGVVANVAEKLYEVSENARRAAEDTHRAFEDLHDKAQLTNDDLAITNDKLQDEIDKLSGHPNNGVQTALDDARKAADKLLESLQADRKELDQVLTFKTPGLAGLLEFGTAGTATQHKQMMADQAKLVDDVRAAKDQYEKEVLGATSASVVEEAARRRNEAVHRAYQTQIDAYKREAANLTKEQNDSVTINAKTGQWEGPQTHNEAKIGNVTDRANQLKDMLTQLQAEESQAAKRMTLGGFKQNKDDKGAADRLKAQEVELAQMKLHGKMSSKAIYDFWESQKAAFDEGSQQYNTIVERQARLMNTGHGGGHDKGPEEQLRAQEVALNQMKLQGAVSTREIFDFWEVQKTAYAAGSQQYNTIVARQAELAVQGAAKAHEALKREQDREKSLASEGSAALVKANAGMDKWTAEINDDLAQTGKRWEGYWSEVAKGREIQAQTNEETAKAHLALQLATGAISPLDFAQREAAAHAELHAAKVKVLREELERLEATAVRNPVTGNYSDGKDAQQIAKAKNQLASEMGKGAGQAEQDQAKVAAAMSTPYVKAFGTIEQAWMTAQRQILGGQRTFVSSMQQMSAGMAMTAIESMEKVVARQLANYLKMEAAHFAANTAKVNSDVVAGTVSGAVHHKSLVSEIFGDAKAAAAGAYKATVGIPFVGPALAPVAAAASFSGVMALAAFEQGTMNIPRSGVAMLHQGEAVLGSPSAQVMREMMGGGGADGNGGTTLNFNFNGNHDFSGAPADFPSQWNQHERHIVSSLQMLHRDGHLNLEGK